MLTSKAAFYWCSRVNVFWKVSQNLQENFCLFFIKVADKRLRNKSIPQSINWLINCLLILLNWFAKLTLITDMYMWSALTLSRRRPLSYRNQPIDLLRKSMGWFLHDNGLRLERVKMLINWPQHKGWNYNTLSLSLSRTFKGPGDLFEIEKVQDIENLPKWAVYRRFNTI